MRKSYRFIPVTGEIVSTDEMLHIVYDLKDDYCGVPANKDIESADLYTTVWYDEEIDEIVDFFNYPIYRESWIQDYNEWIICKFEFPVVM